MRVAADGDDLYIDLADADWHAVRVTAAGWSIVQSPPVRFRRSAGMRPLPFPERGMLDRPAAAVSQYQRERFRARGRVPARRFAAAAAPIRYSR